VENVMVRYIVTGVTGYTVSELGIGQQPARNAGSFAQSATIHMMFSRAPGTAVLPSWYRKRHRYFRGACTIQIMSVMVVTVVPMEPIRVVRTQNISLPLAPVAALFKEQMFKEQMFKEQMFKEPTLNNA